MIESLNLYNGNGLRALPASRKSKCPIRSVGKWSKYRQKQPTTEELTAWCSNHPDAVCLLCGQPSQNLEVIDFDAGGELFDAWLEKVPSELRDKLVIEGTQSNGWHVLYRCTVAVSGNLKLAQRLGENDKIVTLIETRGEGGLIICTPTSGYELVQGDLCNLPQLDASERDALLQAAWELNEYRPPVFVNHQPVNYTQPLRDILDGDRPGDDFNRRGNVRELLSKHGWVQVSQGENERWRRPDKDSGTSATLREVVDVPLLYVFSSNASPFESEQAYTPFSILTHLEHGGDYSACASHLRDEGYGAPPATPASTGVDLSGILNKDWRNPSPEHEIPDPGLIPRELFRVPGFIGEVMDFTMANAPYPNIGLAFCGALALQSFLCGRKVAGPGELRPNIYLLALAFSGTGKDYPRKVNSQVLFHTNQLLALGDKFASGEGLADALFRNNAMLFQNDEMDGVLRQISGDKDNSRESIASILLTMYTSADQAYPMRVKAGKEAAGIIDQPHLTLLGTATPDGFYGSLNHTMLKNGLFSRMMIVDIGKRGPGQDPGSLRTLPESIIQTARWWQEFMPGSNSGNLSQFHPEPRCVCATPEAMEIARELRALGDNEHDNAHDARDEVTAVAYSRLYENAMKLALLYACSANHEAPEITSDAMQWARAFCIHQTQRKLYLARQYVSDNPFHADCLRALRKIRKEPGQQLPHQLLLKRMKMKARDFRELMVTLIQRGDVIAEHIETPGRTGTHYRLAGVKEGGES